MCSIQTKKLMKKKNLLPVESLFLCFFPASYLRMNTFLFSQCNLKFSLQKSRICSWFINLTLLALKKFTKEKYRITSLYISLLISLWFNVSYCRRCLWNYYCWEVGRTFSKWMFYQCSELKTKQLDTMCNLV